MTTFQEHPQSILLTDSLAPVLRQLHPDGNYAIGQDCGIYWRETDPPERGAEAPDWFYVPNVPPLLDGQILDGQIRRSYVLWREYIAPMIALEFASGDGAEERDRTPLLRTTNPTPASSGKSTKPGKFWVYEQIIHIPYYCIYVISSGELELYELVGGSDQAMQPNDQGRFVIEPMGIELGVWQGFYENQEQRWLRWWDGSRKLLPTGHELAAQERERAEAERERGDRLAARLRELGIDPDSVA